MNSVGGILVLYNPNWNLTQQVIDSLLPQVDLLYIMDNSPKKDNHKIYEDFKVKYQYLNGNKGIAYAQNEGLRLLQNDKLDFCFFIDQDSIVDKNMVSILKDNYFSLVNKGINVGGIGPRPYNRQQGKEYRGSIRKGHILEPNITEVSEIISSASLIPVEKFTSVGTMDSYLFIDGVDHEWCWRCSHLTGARFFICEETHLSHQLGEGDHNLLWRKVAIPTPFRTYYQFRNFFILAKRKYVPIYWKLSNGFKYCIKLFYFPLFISPRKEYIKNIFHGIKDGAKCFFRKNVSD